MRVRVEERALARSLRREGYSYREIRAKLGDIPKGTLNYWLRDVALTEEQERRLVEKARNAAERGRQRGALTNRRSREQRMRKAQVFARQTFEIQLANPLFPAGVILYACEGARTSNQFAFTNSDPKLVKLMIRWLREICRVPEEKIHARVYTHRIYEDKECEFYWHRVTRLPMSQFGRTVYKRSPHTQKKNPTFMGCCRLDVYKVDFFFVIRAWQELLADLLLQSSLPRTTGGNERIWEGILQISAPGLPRAPDHQACPGAAALEPSGGRNQRSGDGPPRA